MIWEKLSPRSMWFLVGGNQPLALCNGEEIFSAVLHAVRGTQKTNILEIDTYWARASRKHFEILLSECIARASRFASVALCIVGIVADVQSRLDRVCTT
jgi:hypothetical protein